MNIDATEAIANVTRRALEELDDFPEGAELRAVMILLDVGVPDPDVPDDPSESYTHIVWKSEPAISSAHALGMCEVAGYGIARDYHE
jgi:hypothetical protein